MRISIQLKPTDGTVGFAVDAPKGTITTLDHDEVEAFATSLLQAVQEARARLRALAGQ